MFKILRGLKSIDKCYNNIIIIKYILKKQKKKKNERISSTINTRDKNGVVLLSSTLVSNVSS